MTKVISLRSRKKRINKPIKKNRKINILLIAEKYKIAIFILCIFGILLGAYYFKISENSGFIQSNSDNFALINSGNFKEIFLCLLKLELVCFTVNLFIGTSFIGSVMSFIPPMLKGVYIGYLSSYLYNEYELKGVLFCLLLLFPCFAITTASLIFASNENVYMSKYILNLMNGKSHNDNISIKLYLLRYLLLVTVNIVCIAVTSLLISYIGPRLI